MAQINKNETRQKRHTRVRKRVQGTTERPRLNIYRSTNNIYAQVIDDTTGTTLAHASTLTELLKSELGEANKTEAARIVGRHIARLCKEKSITQVVFDRNGYMYHGRVVALADGAREGELDFGMAQSDVEAEVERYIVMPGQACAYKVGMLKILELRERAQQALGAKFNLPDFHDVVLKNGALPLEVLEQVVNDYIATKKTAA